MEGKTPFVKNLLQNVNIYSGPFCRHWGDPSDCDELCLSCGHKCCNHEQGYDGDASCRECKCKEYKDEKIRLG